ncbi:MAG: DUF3380 domain-containing protein [Caldilineaceae bacterium]|nr:DUF3380 domain-containing protein [Caldilineaceae bacterium]
MNKLGFYTQNNQGVHEQISNIQPPVILLHAWDQGLLQEIRQFRAPDAFVIGRMDYVGGPGNQTPVRDLVSAWLDSDDPAAHGRAYAEHILGDNFQLAQKRENGRLLVDAWMSLNECIPGPASGAFGRGGEERAEIERRLRAYDRFQVAFRDKLMEHSIEAVAFNFGAGNFTEAAHYLDYFPKTLDSYTYLGFHEYGWPALNTAVDPSAVSSAGSYRPIVEGIRQRTGRSYKVIITEAGLARMYKHQDGVGDVGWCYPHDSVNQDHYWRSLDWFNDYMAQDDYVIGACLFQVGHGAGWETFRHMGQDSEGRPIEILDRVRQLRDKVRPAKDGAQASPQLTPVSPERVQVQFPQIYTNQQVINAASAAAKQLGLEQWDLLTRVDQRVEDLAQNRNAVYAGPSLDRAASFSAEERTELLQRLLGELLQRLQWEGQVNAPAGLNLRAGPAQDQTRITTIPNREIVQVLHEQDGWLFVAWQGQPGYLSAAFVNRRSAQPKGEDNTTALKQTWARYRDLLQQEAGRLGIDPAVAVAVLLAESGGRAFAADGRLIVRFENHIFFQEWGHRSPDLFARFFEFDPNERWKGHRWRRSEEDGWKVAHTGLQTSEWDLLNFARSFHEEAALRSISMGAAQIMGFNHATVGYASAQEMFNDFQQSEENQIRGFFRFVEGKRLVGALRRSDFLAFAAGYNGSGQAETYRAIIARYVEMARQEIPELGAASRGLSPQEAMTDFALPLEAEDVAQRLPQPLSPEQLGGKSLAEADLALYEAWRTHIEQGLKNNQIMFDSILRGFMNPYWTTVWMYRILFAVGILSFVAAIVLAYLLRGDATTALGSAAIFGGLGVISFLSYFLSRPLQALEENLQLITWLGVIYNSYWTRLTYMTRLETVQEELDETTNKTIAQLNDLLDKHSALGKNRPGLR